MVCLIFGIPWILYFYFLYLKGSANKKVWVTVVNIVDGQESYASHHFTVGMCLTFFFPNSYSKPLQTSLHDIRSTFLTVR